MATIIRTETRKRGVFGWIFLVLFWAFNAIMAYGLFAGISDTAEKGAQLTSEAAQNMHATGAVIGTGLVLLVWVLGAGLLGLFVLLTRGKKVTIETVKE